MACALGAMFVQGGWAQAEENWMWRIRAIHIAPDANFDVKKRYIETDVKSSGAYLTTFKINPVVWGVGYGRLG